MNYADVLQQFCRKNLKRLTSRELTRDEFKGLVREHFFTAHANKHGLPSIKEVQVALVGLLRKNGIASKDIIILLDTVPLFTDLSNAFREQLLASLAEKEYSSELSPEVLESIKKIGAYRTLEQTKGDQIEQEKQATLQQLNEQIEAKRQEYDSLPSLLDEAPVEEPDFKPSTEDEKPWWERFYLKADPFPRKDGLSAIAEDMYEAVISKTQPFVATLGALKKNHDCLFHVGFLLVGGYGYGKTTFIDYLSYHLINTGVLPVRITCTRCSADASGFADSFFHRLRKVLIDEAGKMMQVDAGKLADLEVEDQVLELVKMITSRKRGVLIFLDDYHKFASHFSQIYEFLGTLQVLKDSFTRHELPVGFIVSGIPEWQHALERNSQLSGFLDGAPIVMPEVSADLVCEVFNRRLKAYCYEGTPRLLRSDFVHKLVREFAGKAGFRDYIGKIVSELTHNNYAVVDSPIEISEVQLLSAREQLETDSQLKAGIIQLVHSSAFKRFNQEQVAKTLELLVHIGMQGGITETDRQFAANRFYFQTLKECGLIQKQRSPAGTLSWGLHARLRKAVTAIHERSGLSLQDYLLKLYAYKGYGSARAEPATNAELTELKKFFGNPMLRLVASVEQNIALGLRALESVAADDSERHRDADKLSSAHAALNAFSEALFTLDKASQYFSQAGIKPLADQWELHPENDEVLTEAFVRHRDYQQEKTPHRLALALKQQKEAAYMVAGKLKLLLESQTGQADITFLHRPLAHSEEEIQILRAVVDGRFSTRGEDHFDYVRRMTDWLELRFRAFFYVTGNLVFGQNYVEQCPKAVVAYAYKSMETRVVYSGVDNRFEGFTRSQYRQILTEGNPFRDHIVAHLDLPWKTDDWALFGELFAEINIDTAHLQVSAFDVTQRMRYVRYCAMAEELTAAMNQYLSALIERHAYLCTLSSAGAKPEEILFKYDFRQLKFRDETDGHLVTEWPKPLASKPGLVEHDLATDAYDRVYRRLLDKIDNSPNGILAIDLLNVEYLTDHYRVTFIELVNSLSFIRRFDRDLMVRPWIGSSVMVRKVAKGP